MAKIYQYRKYIDKYTTHALQEPDYEQLEIEERITELCAIDGITYVSVPDMIVLPEQSVHIKNTLKEVGIDDTLRQEIKKRSIHVHLINQRVIQKIREKYSIDEEFKMNRRKLAKEAKADADFTTYNTYVKSCIAWGDSEIAKLGL